MRHSVIRSVVLLMWAALCVPFIGCAKGTDRLEQTQGGESNPPVTSPSAEPQTTSETQPVTVEADWTQAFDGLQGTAVLFDPAANRYWIYNEQMADRRRSPCSTFKIIAALTGLESGVIDPDHAVRPWSGEVFWNEDWNRDIDFTDAFQTSCVWYFRQVIDEIGKERMQQALETLQYGNCDISDWEGRLNTNNDNRALTGFWIESSLQISPKEQVQVLERVFGQNAAYSKQAQDALKQVMCVSTHQVQGIEIYGKTGMGKADGVTVDAWFTGFADAAQGRVYFCVYLGQTSDRNVSSTRAREIALEILDEFFAS